MTIEKVICCEGIAKSYPQDSHDLVVLQDLDLEVIKGERLAIVGSSGSGKTTLLNIIGGLDDPTGGRVSIMEQAIQPMNESERARWRNRHLGFVYQFHHLLGEFTALENVLLPLMIAKVDKLHARERASRLLERVGLAERLDHRPHELSGGERQRVAIARSLANRPSCVLMDEPTGNLDPKTAERVLGLLLELNREFETSFVIVTHDEGIAGKMDRVMELNNQKLEAKA